MEQLRFNGTTRSGKSVLIEVYHDDVAEKAGWYAVVVDETKKTWIPSLSPIDQSEELPDLLALIEDSGFEVRGEAK